MAELRWGSATHQGLMRDQNEDHHHAGDRLFVVADGMGGHLAGEIASEMAVERLRGDMSTDGPVTVGSVVAAIDAANREIYEGSTKNVDQAGMGTTVTAVAIVTDPHDGEVFAIANVGDSRCYVLRHGRLRQLTIDHSFVQELVAEGAITREEARTHPRRNIVTRALGIEPAVRVDSWTMPVFRGDRFVLCSDGLSDYVTEDQIVEHLLAHPDDPDAAAHACVDAANEGGGGDNITVVIVDVLEGDDPPDATEEIDIIPAWADDGLEHTGEIQIVADPLPDNGDGDRAAVAPVAPSSDDDDVGGAADSATSPDATAAVDAGTPSTSEAPPVARKRPRRVGFFRFLLVLGIAAVLVVGFAITAAWARSGYFVAFDDDGRVVVYQGRELLWFEPTPEAYGAYTRDELAPESVDLVDDQVHFESQASALRFVRERLHPIEEDADEDDEAVGDEQGEAGTGTTDGEDADP